MRVALTGAAGFVGANLVRALLRRGDDVHLLNRSRSAGWRIDAIRKDVSIHLVDLRDAANVRAVVGAIAPEVVLHLAQFGGYAWQLDLNEMIATNYLAGVNLLQGMRDTGARLFVNAGSSSEYGSKPYPTREATLLEPNSDYAATKAAFTLHCQQWARRGSRPAPTLRLYSVYGPFEEPKRLIPRLVSFGLEGRLPPLAAPDTARDFVFVGDVVDAFLRTTDAPLADPGAIFNICSGRQTTLREAVDVARTVLAIPVEPRWGTMASRGFDSTVWVGDPANAASGLGWRSETTLAAGLRKFADWLEREPGMRAHYAEMRGAERM
jgi:dolichol-phosphate mannosyltransferase